MNVIKTFTPSDLVDYGDIPIDYRAELDAWITHFRTVTKPITASLRRIASAMGVSYVTARRKYDALRKAGGDWRALIDRARIPSADRESVSEEFMDWFKTLAESYQRKTRPAHREFERRWLRGEEIPGLDNTLPRHSIPRGTSYKNLIRCLDELALKLTRQGTGAAYIHLPKVFTTRAGLWVGSHYMYDDQWHDNFVVFKGQTVRPVELDALDVFSACKFAWGCKPRFAREDGSFDTLKEKYMRLLLAGVFFNEGYSPRGTTNMAEHGTAAIPEWLAQLLYDRSGGLIVTRRSGITGQEQDIIGQFRGDGKGNPRFKAPLESLRNLIRNELAALPGQTGKDVDHRPEQTHGLLTYTTQMLKAIAVLAKDRPDRAALIRLPMLEYHSQFLPVLRDVYETINRRDWHELEGWAACGHIAIDYRLSPEHDAWINSETLLGMAAEAQTAIVALARTDNRCLRQRQLSPKEVWNAGRSDLIRLPAFVVAEILGDDFAREEPCEDSYFCFQDEEIAPEMLRYESRIVTPDGREEELAPDTYCVFVNPFDPAWLFVHDARKRYLGMARRDVRPSRADADAVKRAMGRVNKRHAELIAPINRRHAANARATTLALKEHNNAVIDTSKPFTPEEKARARALRKFDAPIEDLVATVPQSAVTTDEGSDDDAFSAEGLL